MALRNPNALLGTLVRAGVLCLAPSGRTCLAHGLPSTPDSLSFTPVSMGITATCGSAWMIESWDATSVIFVNSYTAVAGYLRAAVEGSLIQ